MKIWENFEKKRMVKGDDFPGQLIYESEDTENIDFSITRDGNYVTINWGHGYLELTLDEFVKGLFK